MPRVAQSPPRRNVTCTEPRRAPAGGIANLSLEMQAPWTTKLARVGRAMLGDKAFAMLGSETNTRFDASRLDGGNDIFLAKCTVRSSECGK
jgi:hypothetical protein